MALFIYPKHHYYFTTSVRINSETFMLIATRVRRNSHMDWIIYDNRLDRTMGDVHQIDLPDTHNPYVLFCLRLLFPPLPHPLPLSLPLSIFLILGESSFPAECIFRHRRCRCRALQKVCPAWGTQDEADDWDGEAPAQHGRMCTAAQQHCDLTQAR